MRPLQKKSVISTIVVFLSLAGCAVGPDYPAACEVPKNWKEATPPMPRIAYGWWEIFDEPGAYNTLEAQRLSPQITR